MDNVVNRRCEGTLLDSAQRRRASRASVVVLSGAYALLLRFVYLEYVQPLYEYRGYGNYSTYGAEDIGVQYDFALFGIALLPTLWMRPELRRPSEIAYWFLYILVFIPTVTLPVVATGAPPLEWTGFSTLLLACLGALEWAYRVPLNAWWRGHRSRSRFVVAFLVISAGVYLAIFYSFEFTLRLPSLADVYDVRADYKSELRWGNRLTAYAVGWVASVINPLFIILGFERRKLSILGLGVFGQLFVFSVTGFKGALFSTLLLAGLLFSVRRRNFGVLFLGAAVAILVASILETAVFGSQMISQVIVRRVMMTPAILTGLYFDFFSHGPKLMLSHSILSGVVSNPYGAGPATLIGSTYFGPSTFSNANIWADGYANFGYAGLPIVTVVLGLVFRMTDTLARGVDRGVSTPLVSLPAFSMTNSALLTSLLSHGWLLAAILIAWLPRSAHQDEAAR